MGFLVEHMVIRIVGNDEAMFDRNSYFAKSVYVMLLMFRRYRSVQLVSENNDLRGRMAGDFIHKVHWINEVDMSRHVAISISCHRFVPSPYGHIARCDDRTVQVVTSRHQRSYQIAAPGVSDEIEPFPLKRVLETIKCSINQSDFAFTSSVGMTAR